VALILRDSGEYEEAGKKLREVVEGYERLFGKEHLHTLTAVDGPRVTYKNQKKWRRQRSCLCKRYRQESVYKE